MDATRLKELLHLLGAEKVRTVGDWVTCSCLFAPYTHAKGKDSNPSFGLSIHPTSESRCSCFTCGESHNLYEMVLRLRKFDREEGVDHGRDFGAAIALALQDEDSDFDMEDLSYEEASTGQADTFYEFPKFWLESFPKMPNHPYLKERGIPEALAKEMGVRFDFQKQRICFPYWDFEGRCAGMQGRDVTGQSDLRYLSYLYEGRQNRQIWMGEHLVNFDEPIILTEGPVDYASIRRRSGNVLASLTSALGENKLKRLEPAFCIYTAYDFGTGGDKARATIEQRFPDKLVIHMIPNENPGDFGGMTEDQVQEMLDKHLTNE